MNNFGKNLKSNINIIAVITALFVFINVFMLIFIAASENKKEIDDETGFYIAVDYYSEKIRIFNPNSLLSQNGFGEYMEIYDNNNVINGIPVNIGKSDLAENISIADNGEYMYALKAVSDDTLESYINSGKHQKKITALQNEKWYPIYGGGIDISKAIPAKSFNNPKKQYYIAIRKSEDIFDTEEGYKTRITALIKPRYNGKDLNKFIEYDAENEKIILSENYKNGDYFDIIYRFDYFEKLSCTLSKNGSEPGMNIDLPRGLFSLGGNVYISSKPVLKENQYGSEVVFAKSKEIKFKIPKTPDLPAVRADFTDNKLVSLKKGSIEWSLTGDEKPGSWYPYEKNETTLRFNEIFETFFSSGEKNINENGDYTIYFRTKAVAKKNPASMPKKIIIPAELCR